MHELAHRQPTVSAVKKGSPKAAKRVASGAALQLYVTE
jgi:hypothetical protein